MRTLIDQSAHSWTGVSRCALLPMILAFLPLTPSLIRTRSVDGGAGIFTYSY